ncbi:MAG: hypothetical protein LBP60_05040 [Spirochaetaceae bacterium]|nr:hypothetical protein [Spirochaetaceae bacterium]
MQKFRARFFFTRSLLGKLIKWTVWAIMILDFAGLIWYVLGSYGPRDDLSQLFTLRFCLIVSLLLVISAFYGLILDLFYALNRKKIAFLIGGFGYLLIIALGLCFFLAAAFIIGAAGGNM